MNIRTLSGMIVVFAVGIAVGRFCPGPGEADRAVTPGAVQRVAAPDGSAAEESAALKAAQEKIAQLEQRVASLSARTKEPSKGKPGLTSPGIVIDGSQTNLEEVLAQKLSSEEFQKVKEAFERMKKTRAKRAQGRREFLAAVDLSAASKAERKTHEDYLKLIAEQEELMGRAKGFIPDQKTLGKLVELQMKAKPLAEAERKTLLRQMSASLGYAGDDADVVAGTVEDIVGATSSGVGEALNSIAEGFGGGDGDSPSVEVQTQVLGIQGNGL